MEKCPPLKIALERGHEIVLRKDEFNNLLRTIKIDVLWILVSQLLL